MNPLVRMSISLGIALAVYGIFWLILYRRHRVSPTFWARTAGELKLRTTPAGWGRIFISWALAFVAYAFVIEDSGEIFVWQWLEECLLKGDWIGVLLIAGLLTLCERYLASRKLARVAANESTMETNAQPAPSNS